MNKVGSIGYKPAKDIRMATTVMGAAKAYASGMGSSYNYAGSTMSNDLLGAIDNVTLSPGIGATTFFMEVFCR